VKEAVVTVVGSPGPGAKRLAAYVVPQKIEAPQQPASQANTSQDANPSQVLTGLKEREAFKENRLNLRPIYETDIVIRLNHHDNVEEMAETYKHRRSYRAFQHDAVPFERFSEFLQCLRQLNADGKPKFQYASAGGLYPVQIYIQVKPGRVENVSGGAYYYYPVTHELVHLSTDDIGVNCHWPANQEAFQNAAFSIFLIAEMASITPLYGKVSRDFCLLEAGMIMQLLEIAGQKNTIGLCQIGSLDFEHLRPMFQLHDSQILLYSAVGGSVTPLVEQTRFELPEYHRIIECRLPEAAAPHIAAVDATQLREHLQNVLPAPLIPAHWVMLDALPLSANGKVDRKALPPPEDPSAVTTRFIAPSSEMEQRIANAAAEELKLAQVGVEENFFELGANSINLVRVNTRLRNEGLVFPVVELFQFPTVASLSKRLANGHQPAAPVRSHEEERARKQRKARARHVVTS
jgi:SagB-type dehydrogenase family enzyme